MPNIEDRKLTPKENFLRMHRGEEQEWAPVYTMGAPLPNDEPIPVAVCVNSPTNMQNDPAGDGMDIWGVHWVSNDAGGPGTMPEPNNFILDDITKWHDVIKAPDFSDLDWEQIVKDDMKRCNADRNLTSIGQEIMIGPFQQFVAFMGFTEGMIAMAEEPEEVKALLEYMMDFYCGVLQPNYCKYLKPDILMIGDDTCAATKPFMSDEMFREFFVPCYKRETELAHELGIPIEFHNCGVAAHFIDITYKEAGITGWDPAQNSNDLVKFKAEHQGKVAILGGWGTTDEMLKPDVDDDVIRQSVRDAYDSLAPDGGYAFMGHFLGPLDDPIIQHKNDVVINYGMEYGYHFYD